MESPNDALQKGDCVWNLTNIPLLEEYLSEMEDDPLKDIVKAVIEKFKTDVQPKLNFFRKGKTSTFLMFCILFLHCHNLIYDCTYRLLFSYCKLSTP